METTTSGASCCAVKSMVTVSADPSGRTVETVATLLAHVLFKTSGADQRALALVILQKLQRKVAKRRKLFYGVGETSETLL